MKRRKAMKEITFGNQKDIVMKIMLDHLEFIEKQMIPLETEIKKIARDSEDVKLLMSIPSIDYYLASLISSYIGDITRFDTSDKLASFFGIITNTNDSSTIKRRGHMSRDSAQTARWALSIAVDTIISCRSEYTAIQDRIRKSKWVHVDETGFHVNGKKYWLWSFRSAENDTLIVITDSRGRNVVMDTLGDEFHGPVIVDGWKAYSYLTIIQRCWSHLIREVDAFKSSEKGKALSDEIHAMFGELKVSLELKDMNKRKSMKETFDKRMEELVKRYDTYGELHKPVEYIRNGLRSWFTCLLYPGMEPTNNLAEQAIREHVVIRKIIGTFRSESGAENYQYIAYLLSTWRLQGKDQLVELDNILRKELCGFG